MPQPTDITAVVRPYLVEQEHTARSVDDAPCWIDDHGCGVHPEGVPA